MKQIKNLAQFFKNSYFSMPFMHVIIGFLSQNAIKKSSVILLLFYFSKLPLASTAYTWIAPSASTGDWGVSTNWSPTGVPDSGDDATLNSNFNGTFTFIIGGHNIRNLSLSKGASGSNFMTLSGGNIALNEGGTIALGLTSSATSLVVTTSSVNIALPLTLGTFDVAANCQMDLSGTLSGGGFRKTGLGKFTASGARLYSGVTTVSQGEFVAAFSGSGVVGSTASCTIDGTLTVDLLNGFTRALSCGDLNGSGTINMTGDQNLFFGSNNNDCTFSGTITGPGETGVTGINKRGSGTFTFSGTSTYTGTFTVDAGTMILTASGSLGPINLNGGNLTIPQDAGNKSAAGLIGLSTSSVLNLNNNTLDLSITSSPARNYIYQGTIVGTGGGITKGGNFILALTGANTYTGTTTMSGGQLNLSGSGTIGASTAPLVMDGGTLTIAAATGARTIGGLSGAGGTIALNDNTLTITQGADGTFAGSITGTGAAITKNGGNTLTLSGASNYTGTTTINAGGITLSGSGTIGGATAPLSMSSGTFTIASGAGAKTIGGLSGAAGTIALNDNTLTITQGADGTFAGTISGTGGGITKSGANILTLTAANTYTGTTTITAGEIVLSGSGKIGGDTAPLSMSGGTLTLPTNLGARTIGGLSGSGGTIALNNNALTITQGVDGTFAGTISGSAGVTKQGGSSLTLSGNSTYSGTTTISAGTLAFSGSTTGLGGGITNNSAVIFSPSADTTFANAISGSGTLTQNGTATLNLTAANSYGGTTTISSGGITLTGSGTIGATTAPLSMSGGTLTLVADLGARTIGGLIGAGGAIALNNNTLTVTQGVDGTFAGIIGGSGGVTKNGANVLTLTAANTYTGTTTITAGGVTLSGSGKIGGDTAPLSMSGGTLTLVADLGARTIGGLSGAAGTIALNNNTLTVTQGADGTFAGTISGSGGGITKSGANTLTLTAANTYTGTTTITAGGVTLSGSGKIGGDTAPLSMSGGTLTLVADLGARTIGGLSGAGGTIALNNNTLTVTQGSDGTFAGIIGGSGGGITKSGANTLTLTAANTYTGTTTTTAGGVTLSGSGKIGGDTAPLSMSGGTLTLVADLGARTIGGLSGAAGTIALNNNTLTVTQGADGTFAGTISGTGGGITKSGANTLTLTAANTYTGTTTITAGGVTLSGSGKIGGDTALLSMSGGTLTLATGIGARTIGGLSGSGGTIALNNNALTVTQGNDATFSGAFSGTSSANIVKEGANTLTLTGTSSGFLGDTTINDGILVINGTLNGETTVNANGRLQGTGALNDLRNLGVVAPGNSIGTMVISGDFTVVDPAAILEIEIDPNGASDKLVITGTADLDGYVQLLPDPGVYTEGMQFLILSAGNITGDFLGMVVTFPQNFHLSRAGNNIYIVVDITSILSPYASLLTGNSKSTYDYLTCIAGEDPNLQALQNILLALPNLQELSNALVQLCPALYSALPLLELQNNVHMAQVMTQKNRKYFCDCNHNKITKRHDTSLASFWVQPIGFYYNQKGVQTQYGFHDYTYGSAFGFLMPLPSGVLLDLGLGYTHSALNWNNNRGRADANTVYFSPGLSLWFDPFCLSLIVQGDVNFYNVKRNIAFTGVNQVARSDFQSYDILCGVDFSAKIEMLEKYQKDSYTPFYLEPMLQLYCMNFFQQRFVEEDAGGLNLSVGHKHTVFLQPNLGLKITQEFRTKSLCFAPNLFLGYLANIPLSNSNYTSNMPGFNIPCYDHFTVYGYDRVTNQLSLGAEFVIKKCDSFLFTSGYNATMFSHLFTQRVNLRFSLDF